MSDKPKQYVNIKIPRELAEEVGKLVEEKKLGYRSKAEFVAEATRQRLMEIRRAKE